MVKHLHNYHPIFFLIVATSLEVLGDALIRMSIYNHVGIARIGLAIIGMVLLFGYGFFLNLAPVEFGQVVGLYIATLFVVWQIITYLTFRTTPSPQIIFGGCLIVLGGLIITFWKN
jgi:drug/metabolite transporter (DMT)-like permease